MVAAQETKLEQLSPLQMEEIKLAQAPSNVQYEIVRRVFTNMATSERNFRYLSYEARADVTSKALYLATLDKEMLIASGRPALADIVNKMALPGTDPKTVALQFEAKYHEMTGKWPDIVGVDTDAVTQRLLDEATIR